VKNINIVFEDMQNMLLDFTILTTAKTFQNKKLLHFKA